MQSPSLTQTPTTKAVSAHPTQFYTWKDYRCAYEYYTSTHTSTDDSTPLLLVHPIGVGLSSKFWHRFCHEWLQTGCGNSIYNPDLLGCGESDMPHIAYTPIDWAEQLQHFLQTVVQKPVVIIVQGALLPVAIALVELQPNSIRGLVLAGPPAWAVMTQATATRQQRLTWNLLDSPLGAAFYRYARRPQFLRSFSTRQLFASAQGVDSEWLEMLVAGAENLNSRHAVNSFLAGFWRQNYELSIKALAQPTLVTLGESASSISRAGKAETPDQRLSDYLEYLPQGQGFKLPGRNVLPYESTTAFVEAIVPFIHNLHSNSQ